MKTLKCDLCDTTATGETFDEWMKALYPHYQDAHPEIMNDSTKTQEDRGRWMKESSARFDAAPEDE